jgi:phage terminase small subunit
VGDQFEKVQRGETVVPDMSEYLHGGLARTVWNVIRSDEAAQRHWSSGDHAVAAMLAVFIDGQFRKTEDGKPRVVGPDSMRVIIQAANELMLTASSKRRLGVILEDDGEEDGEWADQFRQD